MANKQTNNNHWKRNRYFRMLIERRTQLQWRWVFPDWRKSRWCVKPTSWVTYPLVPGCTSPLKSTSDPPANLQNKQDPYINTPISIHLYVSMSDNDDETMSVPRMVDKVESGRLPLKSRTFPDKVAPNGNQELLMANRMEFPLWTLPTSSKMVGPRFTVSWRSLSRPFSFRMEVLTWRALVTSPASLARIVALTMLIPFSFIPFKWPISAELASRFTSSVPSPASHSTLYSYIISIWICIAMHQLVHIP